MVAPAPIILQDGGWPSGNVQLLSHCISEFQNARNNEGYSSIVICFYYWIYHVRKSQWWLNPNEKLWFGITVLQGFETYSHIPAVSIQLLWNLTLTLTSSMLSFSWKDSSVQRHRPWGRLCNRIFRTHSEKLNLPTLAKAYSWIRKAV